MNAAPNASPNAAEPLFNAPGPVLVAAAAILLPYLLESAVLGPAPMIQAFALVPAELANGRLWPLLSVILVHGSWIHAGLNTLGVLAFGTPVARWFGRAGWARWFGLYLLCAAISSVGYALLHWGSGEPLVGASGAISGLMGASSRLLDRRGGLSPFRSRTVLAMAGAWVLINALMAFRWIDVGAGDAPIAWDAHLIGYAAGLLLIGPFSLRLARPARDRAAA